MFWSLAVRLSVTDKPSTTAAMVMLLALWALRSQSSITATAFLPVIYTTARKLLLRFNRQKKRRILNMYILFYAIATVKAKGGILSAAYVLSGRI